MHLYAGFIYGAIQKDYMKQIQMCLNNTPSIEHLYPFIGTII